MTVYSTVYCTVLQSSRNGCELLVVVLGKKEYDMKTVLFLWCVSNSKYDTKGVILRKRNVPKGDDPTFMEN